MEKNKPTLTPPNEALTLEELRRTDSGPEIITNAGRIRAMSDEELAKTLCTADFCGFCDYERDNGTCRYIETHPDGKLFDGCVQAALRYLQSPTKEDT